MIHAAARTRCLAPLLAVALASCGGAADGEPLEVRSKAAQQAAGLILPARASIEFVERMQGMDEAVQIIAVMPTADWQALERRIEATVPDAAAPSRDGAGHLGTDHGGWQPGRQAGLTARQVPWRQGTEALNIGAAPAGPGMVRVFLFWFQT